MQAIPQKWFLSWAWQYMPEIPALSRLRQKDHEFQDGLGYKVRPCLLKKKKLWKFIFWSLLSYPAVSEPCFPCLYFLCPTQFGFYLLVSSQFLTPWQMVINNLKPKGWGCGWSGRVLAYQVQGSKFKPQYYHPAQKEKKN